MPTLYVVATPIGNLEDVSLRALRLLREVDLVLAEDTRTARLLLEHFNITGKKLLSYTDHNKAVRIPGVLALLQNADIALVSDAGTPAISDPGIELVAAVREAGFAVVAVPGPSAVPAALSVAGLSTRSYRFVGFLPRQEGAVRRLFESQARDEATLVAFESPQRLRKTLSLLTDVLPERRIAVCRELTKLHEETFVGLPSEALQHFESVRGEIVLIVEGAGDVKQELVDERELAKEIDLMHELGLTRSQAAALLSSRYGVPKRQVFDLWVRE